MPQRLTEALRIMSVAVIVPTYRGVSNVQMLLATLFAGTRSPDEVIVVNNDPEVPLLLESARDWPVQIIEAGLGLNLAGARNLGWRASRADLCLFIDDDNTLGADCIGNLLDGAQDPNVGLAAPIIYEATNRSRIWCGGVKRSKWTTRTRFLLRGSTRWPDQSWWLTDEMPDAFAVPRVVLEMVGGLDELRFPFHYDEADLGERIRGLGLRCIVVPAATVWHSGGIDSDPGLEARRAYRLSGARRIELMLYARVAFHRLHSRGLQMATALAIFIPIYAVVLIWSCVRVGGKPPWRVAVIRAIAKGLLEGYLREL